MSGRLALGAAVLVLTAGCLMAQPAATLLDHADHLVKQGDYASAVKVYDDLLTRYPDNRLADRALASRQTVASLLAARADVARLRQEVSARDAELSRLKQEVTARDAEVSRLKQDLEKLRQDLENMKKIDLRERR